MVHTTFSVTCDGLKGRELSILPGRCDFGGFTLSSFGADTELEAEAGDGALLPWWNL